MAVISESPPLEVEFNEWVKAMKKDGVRMPSHLRRPTALQDRNRDSDDDDFRDRDYDVAALANNLSQDFRYGIYSNDDNEDGHGSLERDDEDVYFDDESAEVVISSLRLGDEQDNNWFAFEYDKTAVERSSGVLSSPSPNLEETSDINCGNDDEVVVGEDDDIVDTATSSQEPNVDHSFFATVSIVTQVVVSYGGETTCSMDIVDGAKGPHQLE